MSAATKTTDHEEIRRWVEERGGHPARVRSTAGSGGWGVLRIDFPGYSGEDTLEAVAWDDWLDEFESNELAFLHQDQTDDGQMSRFNKLVDRNSDA